MPEFFGNILLKNIFAITYYAYSFPNPPGKVNPQIRIRFVDCHNYNPFILIIISADKMNRAINLCTPIDKITGIGRIVRVFLDDFPGVNDFRNFSLIYSAKLFMLHLINGMSCKDYIIIIITSLDLLNNICHCLYYSPFPI